MPRRCSICSHAQRAVIDADLAAGAGLDVVAARYGLSRPSLQRHRTSHLGYAVTLHIPATRPVVPVSPPAAAPAAPETASPSAPTSTPAPPTVASIDLSASVAQLFTEASASSQERSIQDHVRVLFLVLPEAIVLARATQDPSVIARVAREYRSLIFAHALVAPEKFQDHAGWQMPSAPPDPLDFMHRWLMAPFSPDPTGMETKALAGLAATSPELAAGLSQDSQSHASSAPAPAYKPSGLP